MCVCVCVCVCIRIYMLYISIYIYLYIYCKYLHIFMLSHTHTHTHTHSHTHTYIYIYIFILHIYIVYNWKKNSTDRHLTIIDVFQPVTPYEKPTSSDGHHIMGRKYDKNILSIDSHSFKRKKEKKKERKSVGGTKRYRLEVGVKTGCKCLVSCILLYLKKFFKDSQNFQQLESFP